MEIPGRFLAKAARQFGKPGEAWLQELPRIIDQCSDAWQLVECVPIEDLSINFVCLCTSATWGDVVLKIQGPHTERYSEIEAMQIFNGRHCCPMLAFDWPSAAMLLRRVRPGTPLRALDDRDRQLAVGAAMIGKVPVTVAAPHHLPSYADWLASAASNLERGDGPPPLRTQLQTARELFRSLDPDGAPQVLLHGDLHHDNILMAGADNWVAIDPQGVIGPAYLEAARFIQNHCFPEAAPVDLQDVVRTVEYLSRSLGQPCRTLTVALLILHTLSACWNWEMHEDGTTIQREQEQCAQILTMI